MSPSDEMCTCYASAALVMRCVPAGAWRTQFNVLFAVSLMKNIENYDSLEQCQRKSLKSHRGISISL